MIVGGNKLVVGSRVVGFLGGGDLATADERVPRGRRGVALEGGAVVIGTDRELAGLGDLLRAVTRDVRGQQMCACDQQETTVEEPPLPDGPDGEPIGESFG